MRITRSFTVVAALLALTILLLSSVFAAPIASVEDSAAGDSKTAVSPPNPQASIDDLMAASNGTAKITIDEATGVARFISFPEGLASFRLDGANASTRAGEFLQTYGAVFGIRDSSVELSPAGTETDTFGFTHVNYAQEHEGVDVFAGEIRVHFDKAGRLTAVNGVFIPGIKASPTPGLTAAEAGAVAVAEVAGQQAAGLAERFAASRLEVVDRKSVV